MFGKLGDIATLLRQAPEIMRQAQEMQGKAAEMQERLAQMQVEGTSGGGMVSVTASGQQKILSVTVDPTLMADGDKEMLEDLLVAAVNQAIEKAKAAASEEMSKLTGSMNVPGMDDVMSKFGMAPPAADADKS
jgi:DNA-binding YbaB/EbfC family protein